MAFLFEFKVILFLNYKKNIFPAFLHNCSHTRMDTRKFTQNCFNKKEKVNEWKGLISAKKSDITNTLFCVTTILVPFSKENVRMVHIQNIVTKIDGLKIKLLLLFFCLSYLFI